MAYTMNDGHTVDMEKVVLPQFVEPFSKNELTKIFYDLTANKRTRDLIYESAAIEELDTGYNPGVIDTDMIMEAVSSQYRRLERTAKAFQRALNKQLQGDIKAVGEGLEAVVGKPRKQGSFATVAVQFPLSDGQDHQRRLPCA